MAEYHKPREVKVVEVVNYLNRAFAKAAARASRTLGNKATRTRNNRGKVETTPLYDYQTDFCYMIDRIQRGPEYIAPKVIQEANDLIAQLEAEG